MHRVVKESSLGAFFLHLLRNNNNIFSQLGLSIISLACFGSAEEQIANLGMEITGAVGPRLHRVEGSNNSKSKS